MESLRAMSYARGEAGILQVGEANYKIVQLLINRCVVVLFLIDHCLLTND